MNTQKTPFHTTVWQQIKSVLRAITTPSKRFYSTLNRDELQRIRAVHVTFLALGINVLIISLPLFTISPTAIYPNYDIVMASLWIASVIGYTLSWRGMWRFAMHSVYVVQFLILGSLAFYMEAYGVFALYYLIFTVIWANYFLEWHTWLMLIVAQATLFLLYIGVGFDTYPYIIQNLVLFTMIADMMLVLSRLLRNHTAQQFSQQINLQADHLRATIEASSDAYYLLKTVYDDNQQIHDFKIVEINRVACEQMGMTRAELIGGLICELFPVNRTSGFFEQYQEVFKTGERMEQEYYIPEGMAGAGWYFHQVTKIPDGVVILNRNITRTKQTELELVKRQTRLQSLVDSQSAYLVRTDSKGVYTYANQRFTNDYGYTPESIIGVHALDTIYPDDHFKAVEAVEKCYATPGRPVAVTLRKIHRSGKIRYTDWEFTAIADDMDDISEMQCVGLDATPRIEAEQAHIEAEGLRLELQQQEEMNQIKTRMMTRISHEFRTPLSIIRSSTNLLERYHDKMDEARRNEKLTHINNEVDRLTRMVTDMGRILQGDIAQDIQLIDCDMPKLIGDVIKRYQEHDDKRHPIIAKIQPNFPRVSADINLMDIILNNLMSNAIKYSPANSTIQLSLSYTDKHFSVAVQDKGIGILPNELVNIYEPFFRGTNFDEIGGMGLGLSLVRDAVQAQKGTISVISAVGEGTTFTVTIPR